jgi:hypothetical protein
MPLWLGGNAWIVATGWGIARWDGGKYDVYRFSRTGLRADQDPPALDVFAVLDDDGRTALVRRAGEELACWRIGEGGAALAPVGGPAVRTAIGAGGGAVVAVVEHVTDRPRAILRRATIAGDGLELGEAIALPAPTRARWRSALHPNGGFNEDRDADEAATSAPPFEPGALGVRTGGGKPAWVGTVRLTESPHGIAVASTYSVVVAVLDRATLAPALCVRVPALVSKYEVHALAVPQGVLVTCVAERKTTEYVLIAPNAEVLASCAVLGKEPAGAAETEGVFCGETVEIASNDRLWTLALPTLRPRKHPGGADAFPIAHAVTADGARLVAYTEHDHERPHHWRLVHTPGGTGRRRGREVQMPDFRPPPEPAAPAVPPRVVGPAALGLLADKTPWQVAIGGEAALQLVLANRGGPVKGIYIELTGDAVVKGQVEPISITAGDHTATFTGATPRAELTELAIDPGYVEPTGKRPRQAPPLPPPPSVALFVKIRGKAAGNSLLMVRIGALAGGASAMQGRGITVGS